MELISKITSVDNLRLAWMRARQQFDTNHYFVDYSAVADFSCNLEDNLLDVAAELSSGKYRLSPLRLAPQPKHKVSRALPPPMREVFWLEPRDQVAWLAIANVIGPLLDIKMPPWSYGNRLSDGLGPRRLATNRAPADSFVWSPSESWPVFQRHIVLTARHRLSGQVDPGALSVDERLAWQLEMNQPPEMRLPYWQVEASRSEMIMGNRVHFAAFDFRSFSKSIHVTDVERNLLANLPQLQDDPVLTSLIPCMLAFELAYSNGLDEGTMNHDLKCARQHLPHLPVGLVVQGFLANVAMLPIDQEVSRELAARDLAHFRYFDDHVILADDGAALEEWLLTYRKIVLTHLPLLEFNHEKTKPAFLRRMLSNDAATDARSSIADDVEDGVFDPDSPEILWPLAVFRDKSRAKSSDALALRLTKRERHSINLEIHNPSEICHSPQLKDDWDAELQHYAVFSRMRNLLEELPGRRLLFRQTLFFLSQTGVQGIGSIRSDLEAQAVAAHEVAIAQASYLYQLLASFLPYVALRGTSGDLSSEARRAAMAFLTSISALKSPIFPGDEHWYFHRSKHNFRTGLTIARAILATHKDDVLVLPVIRELDGILDLPPNEEFIAWSAEAMLSYLERGDDEYRF
jgi:hypothetical protein